MPSSPPPAAEPQKQPSADVTPSGVKHPSEDETDTELEGATASAVEPPAEEVLSAKKIPSMKALNGGLSAPSADETPKALNGELSAPSADETPIMELEGARPSAVQEPLSSEKTPSKKASSGVEVRSCRYFLGVPDSDGAMLFVVIVSVLYAFLTPWLLLRVAGQPTAFVWTISILACSYFFIGAIRFSVKMGFLAIFFRISYGALLSVAATHFIGSNSGAAVASLLTFYAAGIFGHTIAEYVQRAKSEAMITPPSGCKEDQKQPSGGKEDQKQPSGGKEDQKQPSGCKEDHKQPSGCKEDQKQHDDEPLMCFLFVHGILSLFILVRMVWVVLRPGSVMFIAASNDHANEALLIVEEFSLETLLLVWPWACFMALILQKQTVVSGHTMAYKVPAAIGALYSLSVVLSIALGEAYGLLALWPTPMAMAALSGYIIAMFSHYNHIRGSLSQDQQPKVQKVLDELEQEVPDWSKRRIELDV